MLTNIGLISAVLSLWILPEIFGSMAIILGAYVWRIEGPNSRRMGPVVIIFGIVCMLMGIYYTSYFGLYNFLP
jgi:hypothetical protein